MRIQCDGQFDIYAYIWTRKERVSKYNVKKSCDTDHGIYTDFYAFANYWNISIK